MNSTRLKSHSCASVIYSGRRAGTNASGRKDESFMAFIRRKARICQKSGKTRRFEIYLTALNSFKRFCGGADVKVSDIDSVLIKEYELFLSSTGLTRNTISFYMRTLRALYNSAVNEGFVIQSYPFRPVYTGVEPTSKRALSPLHINRVRKADLGESPAKNFVRDMFMLSFYLRGMSFVDMCYLKKTDLKDGAVTYRRKKTGQSLRIKIEPWMESILMRYPSGDSCYLLPLIKSDGTDERKQYKNKSAYINRYLKDIGRELQLPISLTMYVSRHSWAQAARERKIPLSVISAALGHDSEQTTLIYLDSIDSGQIDVANKAVARLLFCNKK